MLELTDAQRFWQIIAQIPRGKVATYGQVATLAGKPRMARAVGRALSKLPEGTQLPWHRVINAQGRISFPIDSDAYKEQRNRLVQEGIVMSDGRVNFKQYRWNP